MTLPADIAFDEATRLVRSLASAGYAPSMTIHCGDALATINVATQGPPLPDCIEPPQHGPAIELWSTDAKWSLRVISRDPLNCDHGSAFAGVEMTQTPCDRSACDGPRPVDVGTMTTIATAACGTGCSALSVGGTASFHDALVMTALALKAPHEQHTGVRFAAKPYCEAPGWVAPDASVPDLAHLGETFVEGHLPVEVVQRILRQRTGAVRACFDEGLARDQKLHGKVVVSLIIDANGAVSSAKDNGSDIGDAKVVACIVKAVHETTFPKPDSGTVRVTAPFVLTTSNM